MKAVWNGVVLAESDATEVVEGNHYFPADSIKKEYFQPSETLTHCGWKGEACYYTIAVNGQTNPDAASFILVPSLTPLSSSSRRPALGDGHAANPSSMATGSSDGMATSTHPNKARDRTPPTRGGVDGFRILLYGQHGAVPP